VLDHHLVTPSSNALRYGRTIRHTVKNLVGDILKDEILSIYKICVSVI
jgi:hypothetical protein